MTQLVSELRDGPQLLSASHELEPGARGMLLLVEDLFRLDASLTADTLGLMARNLTSGELWITSPGMSTPIIVQGGDVAMLRHLAPARFEAVVTVEDGGNRRVAEILVATARIPGRGTLRVTAQAILRSGP